MAIELEVIEDRSHATPSDVGFLRVRRLTLRTHYEDGTQSEPYRYDVVDRDALDAVVMLLHSAREGHARDPWVCLRTALRPPLHLRRTHPKPVPDAHESPVIWELPAGLIEAGETGTRAVLETAARETEEEVGYALPPEAFEPLGVPVYLSPGMCGEKIHVVHAEVDRSRPCRPTATEVVEKASRVEWWTLEDALARADDGTLEDCKTELALRRFHARLAR